MTQYRAVLFDLDGTLLDTLSDIAAAANHVLVRHGAQPLPVERYRDLVGDGVAKLFARALPGGADDDGLIASCVGNFREAYGQTWNCQTKPYEGIMELLQTLDDNSVQTAVLSNKPHVFTQQCINEFLGHHPFRCVLGQRDGVPRKPDPASALEIANQLGISFQNSVYVGDTCTDMQTAQATGMLAVGVTWGFRPRQELVEHGAQQIIDHPLELLKLLEIELS